MDIDKLIEDIKRSSRVGPSGMQFISDVEQIHTDKRGAKWGLLIPLGSECPLYVFGKLYVVLAENTPKDGSEFFLTDVLIVEGKLMLQILGGCQLR